MWMVRNKLRPMTSHSCVCAGEKGPITVCPPKLWAPRSDCERWSLFQLKFRAELVHRDLDRLPDRFTRDHRFPFRWRFRLTEDAVCGSMSAQDGAFLRVVDRVLFEPVCIARFVDAFPRARSDAGCQFPVFPDNSCTKPDGSAQESTDQSSVP